MIGPRVQAGAGPVAGTAAGLASVTASSVGTGTPTSTGIDLGTPWTLAAAGLGALALLALAGWVVARR